MRNLYLNTGKLQDVFNDLKDSFNGTLTAKNEEYNLSFASDLAKGSIKGITFQDQITYIQFDLCFHDDVRLSMDSFMALHILFIHCTQGNLKHSFGVQGAKKNIQQQNTGILKNTSSINNILYFERNTPIAFYIIGTETHSLHNRQNSELIKKIKIVFFDEKADYLDVKLQNLKIAEKIEELNTIPQKGIFQNFIKNKILKNIIELETEHYMDGYDRIVEAKDYFMVKSKFEIEKATHFFRNSVPEFDNRFITQTTKKLQEGFKSISGRMVQDFLISMKIERQRI
jgi:AraC family transcriptional regulator, transcriptional activator for feuABC-ybbA operon